MSIIIIFGTLSFSITVASYYSNASENPHSCGMTPLLRAIGRVHGE